MIYNVWMTIRVGRGRAAPARSLPSSPPNEELNHEQLHATPHHGGLFAKHHILEKNSDPSARSAS